MASLKDIKRRIGAVRGTQKVTRAMKLVAAAKLKRAQKAAFDARAYAGELHDTVWRVSRRLGADAPFFWQRPGDINGLDLLAVTSDRGLCGGFNENLLRTVEEEMINYISYDIPVKLYSIGKKGFKFFSSRGFDVEAVPLNADGAPNIDWIVNEMFERFRCKNTSGSNIVFNRFVSTSRQEVTFWNLLPLCKRGDVRERHLEYLYEPARNDALEYLAKATLIGSLKLVLLESNAAELAARMLAMDNATKNADDMIAHLTFVYNRRRQEDITTELMDIVGGAEALK